MATNLPDNLEVGGPVEVAPRFPVILSEWIFDGNNRVFLCKSLVEISQLLVSEPLSLVGIRVLCVCDVSDLRAIDYCLTD